MNMVAAMLSSADVILVSYRVSVVGLQEFSHNANELTVMICRSSEIYTILVIEYLLLIVVVSWGVRWVEKRLNTGAAFR